MDDDVTDVLEREARAASDAHRHAAPVDGLERRDHELQLQLDGHAVLEDDPKRSRSCDGVAERAGSGIRRVVVFRGGDPVERPVASPDRAFSESGRAVRQALPVRRPVAIAAPAVVDHVARLALASTRRQRKPASAQNNRTTQTHLFSKLTQDSKTINCQFTVCLTLQHSVRERGRSLSHLQPC